MLADIMFLVVLVLALMKGMIREFVAVDIALLAIAAFMWMDLRSNKLHKMNAGKKYENM